MVFEGHRFFQFWFYERETQAVSSACIGACFFLGADTAEADGVAAGVGGPMMAVGGTGGVGTVGPGTAAQHALLGGVVAARAAVRRGALVIGLPGVGAPFPH